MKCLQETQTCPVSYNTALSAPKSEIMCSHLWLKRNSTCMNTQKSECRSDSYCTANCWIQTSWRTLPRFITGLWYSKLLLNTVIPLISLTTCFCIPENSWVDFSVTWQLPSTIIPFMLRNSFLKTLINRPQGLFCQSFLAFCAFGAVCPPQELLSVHQWEGSWWTTNSTCGLSTWCVFFHCSNNGILFWSDGKMKVKVCLSRQLKCRLRIIPFKIKRLSVCYILDQMQRSDNTRTYEMKLTGEMTQTQYFRNALLSCCCMYWRRAIIMISSCSKKSTWWSIHFCHENTFCEFWCF